MTKGPLILNDHKKVYQLLKDLDAREYIDPLHLNSCDIETFCEKMKLDMSNREKHETIERKKNPPLMAAYFYYYLYYYKKLPTQKEFKTHYRRCNSTWIYHHIGKVYYKAFEARLDRFYASIMRDLHFYHLAKEEGDFEIAFTLQQDIEEKIDLLVTFKGQKCGIQLRVGTEDSANYAAMKDVHIKKETPLVDFPLNLRKALVIPTEKDSFFFYGKSDIQHLKKKIAT
ncbi:hypothetical protein IMZ31_19785 (plasmid) [Pontibacillus sp. ALD_SL1]|uniref:hypothetical protein n=1 Tax=Pontibacillus sp. ALD_SL1 TaxID=2777185 RepID=UPI001A979E4E|nr:hypothetical protein [Pontibacillus sp. ALD_SL1]QST02793.1 hypothetical protein IMZ31_19785 [Pontibacillus sp. ALD_SL1]